MNINEMFSISQNNLMLSGVFTAIYACLICDSDYLSMNQTFRVMSFFAASMLSMEWCKNIYMFIQNESDVAFTILKFIENFTSLETARAIASFAEWNYNGHRAIRFEDARIDMLNLNDIGINFVDMLPKSDIPAAAPAV